MSFLNPHTSDSRSIPRYVVCKGLKEGVQSVNQYLFAINAALWDLKNEYKTEDDDSGHEETERDVLEVCEGGRERERETERERRNVKEKEIFSLFLTGSTLSLVTNWAILYIHYWQQQ